MSKRFVARLAVAILALGAVSLLQGCGGEDDEFAYSFVWSSTGFMPSAGSAPPILQLSGTW
jgi:hypothetical protein